MAYPYPGRSTRYQLPFIRKRLISLVFPGVEEVIASFLLPQSMLIRDDLPTLDLPMRANSGRTLPGFPATRVLLPANCASLITIARLPTFSGRKYTKFLPFFVNL